ncbi:GNAT family N-acetyltransferase [Photobacterium sanguinicancri]|uniref:GNAT family N-acetyltransferase n=1 Tax=Photobacterium sanguinicancri TaxID=875932 RepID=UPI000788F4F8|nr:GNAT family N-acetyltransferase [Photobacterium sanguinicancri]KXI22128.1 butyryltransferase [Photobacterium sanguinicancri]
METLVSKTIKLRLVLESDAEFIISLRNDERYNKHLSQTNGDVETQIQWIKEYKNKEKNKEEYYFIVERNDGVPCGTVRLYDFNSESFCWGSWILNTEKTRYSAIESALLVYKYAFEELKFQRCHFDVRKDNIKVNQFHLKFGATKVGETGKDFLYEIYPDDVERMKVKYKKIVG